MRALKIIFKTFLILFLVGLIATGAGAYWAYNHFSADLPEVDTLRDIKFQTPLRIYSADEKLIAEFGEKKRTPVKFDQIPERFVQALIAAEDSNFFEHNGIDFKGLARAGYQLATTRKIKSGGSTITMQVAKNFFLTRERTFTRKFREILLSLKIEQEISKEEIFELYVNKIFLGHRSYGIQAAANVYYGKPLAELSTAQLAMIAGLPKAPSAYNPIANPTRAKERRDWILSRMHSLSFIGDQEYNDARNAPVVARYHTADIEVNANYIAEMVRAELGENYEDIYTRGYRVYTTIDSELQEAANTALQNGLLKYTERHGYKGPERKIDPLILSSTNKRAEALKELSKIGDIEQAIVRSVAEKSAQVLRKSGDEVSIHWEGMKWARPYKAVNSMGPSPKTAAGVLAVGDVIRIQERPLTDKAIEALRAAANEGTEVSTSHWVLTQIPEAQGALISAKPNDGAIQSLVGGFNFHHNKFNRATQAVRQPGSNIKPFVYASALASGMTPATTINDAPVVFHDDTLESNWRPENYSKKFYGPTRLREALYRSRNLVSIRLLQQLGINDTVNYLTQFGFSQDNLPRNLSLSLGAADMTPMDVLKGYATLANNGHPIEPYFISRIEDGFGEPIYIHKPKTVCDECAFVEEDTPVPLELAGKELTNLPIAERTIDKQTMFLITNMMQDVITRGTGRRALALNRTDLAGKTGTTNDQVDAWFSGFNPDYVTSVWVGFDKPSTLGRNEFGGSAALPVWIDYMRVALDGIPNRTYPQPDDIISVKIDPKTGMLAAPGQSGAVFEYFAKDTEPTLTSAGTSATETTSSQPVAAPEDIF